MRRSIRELAGARRAVWPSVLIAAVLVAALAGYWNPVAHAEELPEDCWSEALSADPLHCYALEEAQRDGIIEVEGVYEAESVLYIFFSDLRDAGTRGELDDILKENAREFVKLFPDQVAYDDFRLHRCSRRDPAETFRDCMLGYTFDHASFLPWSSAYDNIHLAPGGAAARQSRPGWASWRQVWPATAAGPSGASGSFDVSGVDVTNFPDVECVFRHGTTSCVKYREYLGFGIAGWHRYSRVYIQVKAAPGEETNVETALRDEFIRRGGPGADGGENTVIIPVKYDYEELWRWQLILNRFALSSGNTIGITGAVVGDNRNPYERAVFPLSSLAEAGGESYSDFRETVHVWALDAQRVANALPTLLPLLGIPVDAVGVVGQFSAEPVPLVEPQPIRVGTSGTGGISSAGAASVGKVESEATGEKTGETDDGESRTSAGSVGEVSQTSGDSTAQPQQSTSASGVSVWTIAVGVIGLLILASMILWTVRSRRRSA